jgi:hypothetical protein
LKIFPSCFTSDHPDSKQLDSATPTFVACNFSAELQGLSVVLARETVH